MKQATRKMYEDQFRAEMLLERTLLHLRQRDKSRFSWEEAQGHCEAVALLAGILCKLIKEQAA